MRRILLALLLLAAPARATELVTLRPFAVVDDPVVRLGDLFENAGPRAGAALGPAPAPGRRMVVETAQLLAVARAHGLDWRPLAAEGRVVVERPGRALAREEIEDLLRAELARLGMEAEAELDLPGFAPPMVPPAAFVRLAVEGAAFDPATARFAVTLAVLAEGMPTLRQRLAGRAVPTVPVVVATRRLAAGEVVGPSDARLVRVRAQRARPGGAQSLEQVIGQQLRRPIAPETIFAAADLAAPEVVQRNAPVLIVLDAPGLAITAEGRALAGAARGALVPVMNLASRAVVEAEAIGPGQVRVRPGAAPLRAAGER
jgi:flagella basal body P-ring formation protein FlgA